jgi:hypothetical protein
MLRLYPKDGHMVPLLDQVPGGARAYFGRDSKQKRNANGDFTGMEFPAQADPFSVNEASNAGRAMLRLMTIESSKPFFAADTETFEFLRARGVYASGDKFVQPTLTNGSWSLLAPTTKPENKKGA